MRKIIFLVSVSLLGFASCTKDDPSKRENFSGNELQQKETGNSYKPNSELYNYILELGFDKKDIVEKEDLYIASGDVVFYKDKEYKKYGSDLNKQRMHHNLVSQFTVRFYLHPSLSSQWQDASIDAIVKWRDVGTGLNLSLTSDPSNADIVIINHTADPGVFLPNNVFGRGTFPTADGKPGDKIWVSSDFNSTGYCGTSITQSMRITNVQHEIGHNLGLTHTNQSYGNQIPDTPSYDSYSVMNGGEACTINDFSQYDIEAINYLYAIPEALTNPGPTICSSQFLQDDEYTIPVSEGAVKYELTSNSPDLYVDPQVYPNLGITMIAGSPGQYVVTLKTTNKYGRSNYASIYVTAIRCNQTGF